MTKAKKTLSVLLAVLMVLSTSLFSAFAVAPLPGEDKYTADFVVETDKPTAKAGDVVNVTVKVTTNYKAATTSARLVYDATVFDAATPVMNDAFFGAGLDKTEAKPYKAEAGKVGGFIVAKENAVYENKTGAVVFTVQLTVKQGVTAKTVNLAVEDDAKKLNHEGSLFCGRYNGKNVVTYGQTITAGKKSIEIQGGAAAAATLVGKGTGFVDEARQYVYGVGPGQVTEAQLNAFFTAENGTVAWTKGSAKTLGGTGSQLTFTPNDGTQAKVYTLIVFGDLNGDAKIDSVDSGAIDSYVVKMTTLNEMQLFAGNLNPASGLKVDSVDSGAIDSYVVKMTTIAPNIYA